MRTACSQHRRGRGTVWESGDWATKTDRDAPEARQTQEGAQSGAQYDLAAFREYAQAVYAATDDYLANVSDDGLEAEVETFAGKTPAGTYVGTTCLWHVISHQGEISALKGAQGLKGPALLDGAVRLCQISGHGRHRRSGVRIVAGLMPH